MPPGVEAVTLTWEFPADSDAWPCPEGCGGLTEDPAGGPCKRCWDQVPGPNCICGPDSTGEAPDERPECPVHGFDAEWGDTGWEGPGPF